MDKQKQNDSCPEHFEQLNPVTDTKKDSENTFKKVLVTGIQPKIISKDHLINYLECLCNSCDVESVQFLHFKNSTALVCFKEPIDIVELQTACAGQPLGEQELKFKPADGAVWARTPNPKTTTDCFMYYFQNTKRSGGHDCLDIEKDENNAYLIVYFKSEEVARNVASRSHTLDEWEFQCCLLSAYLEDDTEEYPSAVTQAADSTTAGQEKLYPVLENSHSHQVDTSELTDLQQKSVNGIHCIYVNILDAFSDLICDQFNGLQITTDNDCVNLEGKKDEVDKFENILLLLRKKQDSSRYIEVVDKFSAWEEVNNEIEEHIENGKYFLIIEDVGMERELLICPSDDEPCKSMSFDQFLQIYVSEKEIPVMSKEAKELLRTTAWTEFIEHDIEDKFERKIMILQEEYNKVRVLGRSDVVQEAARTVEHFLQNAPDYQTFQLTSTEREFLKFSMPKSLETVKCGTGLDHADIDIEGNTLKIRGCRGGVGKAEREWNKIHQNFKCRRVIVSHPNLSNISKALLWDDIIPTISTKHSCLIKQLPDPQISDAEQNCTDWGRWNTMVVHSFNTFLRQQLKCHVVEGFAEDLKVDAAVVCYNQQITSANELHSRPLQRVPTQQGKGMEGAKSLDHVTGNEHHAENITVTHSGALPCKALIHVKLSAYFPCKQQVSFLQDMKKLMTDVFRICQKHHFTSLAVPIIGVDVVLGNQPFSVGTACQAISQCVLEQFKAFSNSPFEKRDNLQERRIDIRDIYLCSKRASCLHGLTYFLQDLKMEAPCFETFQVLPSLALKHKSLKPSAILVTSGDISKTEADVLVVPIDIDIDLDLSKSKITKSLLHRGGDFVQESLRRPFRWTRTPSAEERNEELAETHILTGDGGALRTKEIFYIYLLPWGPMVNEMLTNDLRKCLHLASYRGYRRMAMTALGVGKLGYPPEFVARTTFATVAGFMEQEKTSLQCVTIVVFPTDRIILDAFLHERTEWMKQIISIDDDSWQFLDEHSSHSALSASSSHAGMGKGSKQRERKADASSEDPVLFYPNVYSPGANNFYFQCGQFKLCVKAGDITLEKCDIVVNSINADFDFDKGGVSRAFKKKGAEAIMRKPDIKATKKKMKKKGFASTDAPHSANYKKILHLDLDRFKQDPNEMIKKALLHVMDKYPEFSCIAFPALGTGVSHMLTPEQLVEHIISAVHDKEVKKRRSQKKKLEEIRLIVTGSDKNIFVRLIAKMDSYSASERTQSANSGASSERTQSANSGAAGISRNVEIKRPQSRQRSSETHGISPPGKKHHTSVLPSEDELSLFIFSDNEINRNSACEEIISTVEGILGHVSNTYSEMTDKDPRTTDKVKTGFLTTVSSKLYSIIGQMNDN